ncbi:glycoside hydrolase superfamily [Penicillium odoratum]|uniref:glycoside hydrolase superfamily n=1 Tax=Penicillium odoratum TaxID=1167516 RepID=UPI002546E0C1|nr:glycoside hydrolase superfamily [Penicillium odoratum]KAJ5752578.1 glycoside hydrolase superfamily [Penicillium odoratum]
MEVTAPEAIGNFSSPSKDLIIVEADYLMRSASLCGENTFFGGRRQRDDGDSTDFVNVEGYERLSATAEYNPTQLDIPALQD